MFLTNILENETPLLRGFQLLTRAGYPIPVGPGSSFAYPSTGLWNCWSEAKIAKSGLAWCDHSLQIRLKSFVLKSVKNGSVKVLSLLKHLIMFSPNLHYIRKKVQKSQPPGPFFGQISVKKPATCTFYNQGHCIEYSIPTCLGSGSS